MTGAKIKRKNPDALDQLAQRLKKLGKQEIAVGYPAGKAGAYPDGTPVVEVAAQHVYGIGVPERDFMSLGKVMMIPKVKPALRKMAQMVGKASGNNVQALQGLQNAAGQIGQAEIQAAIVDGSWAPNSTVPMSEALRDKVAASWGVDIPGGMSYAAAKEKFRGSDKPLIDTGRMVQAATYVVRDKSK